MKNIPSIFTQSPKLLRLFKFLDEIKKNKNDLAVLPESAADKRILIFGTGQAGKMLYLRLQYNNKIVAFVDNDLTRHGEVLFGLPIIPPGQIMQTSFDYIYIGSQYDDEIYQHLISDLLVPSEKIYLH